MNWLKEVFGTAKPIIAMCHLPALPGDPAYDKQGGMKKVIDITRQELSALQQGEVDAVMFSNEFSLPYLTKVHTETVASMARIIGELMPEIKVPFGVNVLWDPTASLDLAVATGAHFVREIFTGVYASDFGIWNTNCGEVVRHQYAIGAENVKLIFNILPEAAKYLGDRNIAEIAKSTVFNAKPDALCVSGLTAGSETSLQALRLVKDTVPDTIVFANTGVTIDNLAHQLNIADGAIVGTTFKKDGLFQNRVDSSRVKMFMDRVHSFRSKLNQ
jgi:uncharacterized protein